jgi:hypothetical protein
MPDTPSSTRRTPLPPEEFRPAHGGDYVLICVSLLLAGVMTAPTVLAMWKGATNGEVSLVLVIAAAWNTLVWLLPVLRGLLNWRIAVLAGISEHSYLVRLFWRTQMLLVGIFFALALPLVVLIKTVCGPVGLSDLS